MSGGVVMITYCVPNSYDVLEIPSGWDCFTYQGWLYRKHVKGGVETFYRDSWIG